MAHLRTPVVLAFALALVSMVEPGNALTQLRHRVQKEPDEAAAEAEATEAEASSEGQAVEQEATPATDEAPAEQAAEEQPAEAAAAEPAAEPEAVPEAEWPEAKSVEQAAEAGSAEPAAEEPELKSAEPADEALAEPATEEPEAKSAEPAAEAASAEPAAEEPEVKSAEPAEEAPAEPAAEEPEARSAEPVAAEEPESKSAEPAEGASAEPAAEELEVKSADSAVGAPTEPAAEEPEVKAAEPAEAAPAETAETAEAAPAQPAEQEPEAKSAEPADAAPADGAAAEPEANSEAQAEAAASEEVKSAESVEEKATAPAAEDSEVKPAEPTVEAPEPSEEKQSREPSMASVAEEAANQGAQKEEAAPLTPADVQAKVAAALEDQAMKAGKEALDYQLQWINGVLSELNQKADPSLHLDLKNILRAQADTLPRLASAEAKVDSFKQRLQAGGLDSGLWQKLDKIEDEKYELDQKLHNEKEKAHFLQSVFENSFSFAHRMALTMQQSISEKLKEVQSAIYDRGDNHWANLQKEGQAIFKDFLAARTNMTSISDKLDVHQANGKKAWAKLMEVSDPALVKEVDALYMNQSNLTDRLAESTWRAKELADQMSQEEIAEAGAEWMMLNASLTEAKELFQARYDEMLGQAPAEVAQEVQSTFQEYEDLKAKFETVKARVNEVNRQIQASSDKAEIQKLLGARNANAHLKELLNSVGYVGNLTLADAKRRANKKVVEELENATAQQVVLNQKLDEVVKQDEELQAQLKASADPTVLQAFSAARSDLNEVKAVARALESDANRFYHNIKDTRDQVIDMEKKVWSVGAAQAVWAFHDLKDALDISKRIAAFISDQGKTMAVSMKALAEQQQKTKSVVREHLTAAMKIIDQKRKDFASNLNVTAKRVQASVETLRKALLDGTAKAKANNTGNKAAPQLKALADGMKKGYDMVVEAKKRLAASQAVQKQTMEKARAFSQKVIDAMRAVGEQTLKIEAEKQRPEAKLFRQLAQEAAIAKKTA